MIRKFFSLAATALVGAALVAGPAGARDIKIATEGAYPPFNAKNAKGELIGFDVDIAKAICAEMKANCTLVAQDWDGIIPGLLAKKYDLIVASMSITDERKKKVAFSKPYYSNFLQFVTKEGSGFQPTKGGMRGKFVGAQRSTVSSQYLEDNFRKIARVKVYDKQTAAWLDLKSGRLNAVLADIYPAYDWVKANKGFAFVGKKIDINDKIGIAARKEDAELVKQVDAAIDAIRKNGTYAKINAKYFPFDIY
jgi:lysine-arginine-ornithine-binding protein